MTVNDEPSASGVIPVGLPLLFTANDCLDIGTCLGGPVSPDYLQRTLANPSTTAMQIRAIASELAVVGWKTRWRPCWGYATATRRRTGALPRGGEHDQVSSPS
jgi:hypothetical protein